jgi:hypothetical protein
MEPEIKSIIRLENYEAKYRGFIMASSLGKKKCRMGEM